MPCVAQVSQRVADVSDARQAPRAVAGECVLVVEDESAVRMLVVDALRDLGYSTLESGDAAGAIKRLQGSARIDLLITDVGLPGLNGRQLAGIARQFRPALNVLFMTGYAGSPQIDEVSQAVEKDVLTKPFNVDELAARVRWMLERAA
nr:MULTISPECIES: response regulator [unclassified Pseudomonas]